MIGGVFIYNHKGEVLISVRTLSLSLLPSANVEAMPFLLVSSVSTAMISAGMQSMHFE